jgi:hypothetical protein
VSNELTENHLNHLNTSLNFDPLQPIIQCYYFPDTDLVDLQDETHTDYSSDNHFILRRLRLCLPFGHYLTTEQRNCIVNYPTKLQILSNTRGQHLYWLLARSTTGSLNHPVNHLAIYYNDDHFWHHHVPLHTAAIIHRLSRLNQSVFFLRHFTLLGPTLSLEFGELCLLTNPPGTGQEPFQIVHINGTEYRLDITGRSGPIESPPWHIHQFAHGIALVDPDLDLFIPPSSPTDPNYDPAAQDYINYHLPTDWEEVSETEVSSLPTVSTPPPTLEPPTAFEPGWTNINPYHRNQRCSCTTEFCRCGRRPDTPPTPPNVTLWTPGDQHLPYRN